MQSVPGLHRPGRTIVVCLPEDFSMSEPSVPKVGKSWIDHWLWYTLVVLGVLAVGGGGLFYLIATRPDLADEEPVPSCRVVRAFRAEPGPHRMAITAYGTSRPAEVWTAIAEVKGRVQQLHPQFEPGGILGGDEVGQLLVAIDSADYELVRRRLQADVNAKKKQVEELDRNKANLQTILELQLEQQALAKSEYERQFEAFRRNATSRTGMENAKDAYIRAKTAVQQTENSLELIPVQREITLASLEAAEASLAQAVRDLEETQILVPQPLRCMTKSVEVNQYVREGDRLGTFLAMDLAEVVALLETRKIRTLFPGGPDMFDRRKPLDLATAADVENILHELKIPVEVRWAVGEMPSIRYGRLARIGSSLDPDTRTVRLIIEVPGPYRDVVPGERPPLVPDVFCEVTIFGDTLEDVMVIPREALRDNRVYVARNGQSGVVPPPEPTLGDDGERRELLGRVLRFADIELVALEEDRAVIRPTKDTEETIQPGDLIVLSDLFPASAGMPLWVAKVNNPAVRRESINIPKKVFADWELEAYETAPDVPAAGAAPDEEATP